MLGKARKQITPASILAFVALVFAITGGAFAATGGTGGPPPAPPPGFGPARAGQGQEETRSYRQARSQGRDRCNRSDRRHWSDGSHRSDRTRGRKRYKRYG